MRTTLIRALVGLVLAGALFLGAGVPRPGHGRRLRASRGA